MTAKSCKKGEHEMDSAIFVDGTRGVLVGWQCDCGERMESASQFRERVGLIPKRDVLSLQRTP